MSFKNKVVIVTGSSAGIGAATVVQFAREGAKVVIVGRNEDKLRTVAEQCQSLNAEYLLVKADVANENDAKKIVNETINKFGQLDVLVNNAGILKEGCIMDGQALKIFDEIINTNLRSVVALTSIAAPHLIKTKGNIINVSSVAGSKVVSDGFIAYSTSKAALNMFTVGSASELASYGVRVNLVSPGPVKTEILKNNELSYDIEDFSASTALKRLSQPEEVADLILFVASDKAKAVTGSNYICDNGMALL